MDFLKMLCQVMVDSGGKQSLEAIAVVAEGGNHCWEPLAGTPQ